LDIFKPPQLISKPPKIGAGLGYERGGLKKIALCPIPIQTPTVSKNDLHPCTYIHNIGCRFAALMRLKC